jgi:hypothetical protein
VIVTILYIFVSVFNFLPFERRVTKNHSIGDYSDSPYISFEGVTCLGKDLGAYIVWSATQGRSTLFVYCLCQAEVTNLHLEIFIDQKISKLQVPMHDLVGVDLH